MSLLQSLTSPPTQALTILRSTPATVSFTVSTRPVARTFLALVVRYISHIIRFLIGSVATALCWAKWRLQQGKEDVVMQVLQWLLGDKLGERVIMKLMTLGWRYVWPMLVAVLWWVGRRGYTEESLLVLRGLGVQTSTSSAMYWRPPVTRFIPTTSIQDIFIHEAFKGFEVRFYLSIVVQGEEDVVVVFPRLLPRRSILEEVWRGAKSCLYEPETRMKT